MQKIIGIRRSGDKNIYYFTATEEYKSGDKVVVDFEEFQTVGTVVRTDLKLDQSKMGELKKITRRANEADIKKYAELQKAGLLPPLPTPYPKSRRY